MASRRTLVPRVADASCFTYLQLVQGFTRLQMT